MRMRDVEDAAAWSEFVDLYGPIVFSFCIKRGLSKHDVEDTVQEVMRRIARSMQKF